MLWSPGSKKVANKSNCLNTPTGSISHQTVKKIKRHEIKTESDRRVFTGFYQLPTLHNFSMLENMNNKSWKVTFTVITYKWA